MRLTATGIIAIRALRRNKLRSSLTALGIIIGVAAVIAMVSIGNGAKAQVEAQIATLGQNVITVFPGNFSSGGVRGGFGSSSTLSTEDADAIDREVVGISGVSPEMRDRQQVLANGQNWNTSVYGESPDYPTIRAWPIVEGEMFTDADVRSAAKVCVVGQTIVTQLFADTDPIGQTIRIRNLPFKIVGVLGPKGFSYFGSDQDDVVVVPYTSALKRLTRRTYLSAVLVQAADPALMGSVQQQINDLLNQRRNNREPDFTVRNQAELAATATSTTDTMTALLAGIAAVSLIVGGIGVMNIMLVSVTERTREIGIRLAIGAHDRDIRLQFLIEALILSLIGGTLGILGGVGASQLLSHLNGWPSLVSTGAIVLAFGVSGAVGVGFGFYPAHKAAQLDPIDALRYE